MARRTIVTCDECETEFDSGRELGTAEPAELTGLRLVVDHKGSADLCPPCNKKLGEAFPRIAKAARKIDPTLPI